MCPRPGQRGYAGQMTRKRDSAARARGVPAGGPTGPPVRGGYRCQFCERDSPARDWKDDKCPRCGRKYDCIMAQEGEE